jgi:t-SNARE complex subunit (syntaxin)
MATAQALGVDVAALFGAKKPALPLAADSSEETYTPAETEATEPENENSAANLAAEAAADNEPDFPEDTDGETQQEETEFERLTGTLEEYMSFKEYLNVTTKSGTNPYKLAQDELNSKTATEESRTKMINRIRDYLISKHVPGVA